MSRDAVSVALAVVLTAADETTTLKENQTQ